MDDRELSASGVCARARFIFMKITAALGPITISTVKYNVVVAYFFFCFFVFPSRQNEKKRPII